MDDLIVAIVHIEVNGVFEEQDLQVIESILRKEDGIAHLSVGNQKIFFCKGSGVKLSYDFLDRIKKELEARQYKGFVISAVEYVKRTQGYYFDSQDKVLS